MGRSMALRDARRRWGLLQGPLRSRESTVVWVRLGSMVIKSLKLDADWVVLSACNTAAPDGRLGGQSLAGLARAFFYAGARSLLVSPWAAATQPTVVLTTTLFDAYGKNAARGRAAALRTAQVKLMGEQATSP